MPSSRHAGFAIAASLAMLVCPAGVRAQTPDFNDVQYAVAPLDAGGTQTLSLDLWQATSGAERAPLIIWIHGGAWLAGNYNDTPGGLQAMLDAGFAVASVQYRFSTAAIFPAQIHDVKGAVRFLRARADDYGLDTSRFAAWGPSAGGHLTALLATSGGIAELEGTTGGNLDESSAIQAAVDYFGPTDILQMNLDVTNPPGSVINHDAPNSPESQLIGFDGPGEGIGVLRNNLTNPTPPFPEKAALAMNVNPVTHVDADDPPMFIAHGNQDTLVPLNQSFRLAAALDAVDVEHVMRVVTGAGHGFGSQSAAVNAEAIAFLTAQFASPDGDFDSDGDVDGRDFLKWQRGKSPDPFSDTDLADWESNYGTEPAMLASASTAVPEPTTGLALLFATAFLFPFCSPICCRR